MTCTAARIDSGDHLVTANLHHKMCSIITRKPQKCTEFQSQSLVFDGSGLCMCQLHMLLLVYTTSLCQVLFPSPVPASHEVPPSTLVVVRLAVLPYHTCQQRCTYDSVSNHAVISA